MVEDVNVYPTDAAAIEETAQNGHPTVHEFVAVAPPGGALTDPLMTIGEVAREFGVTLRALRFYEAKRLVTPQRHGAIRLYRHSDRERIMLILTGRRMGFTLAEISELVGKPDGKGLHLTREKCVEQINLLERQKRGIEVALTELRQIYTSFYRKLLETPDPQCG